MTPRHATLLRVCRMALLVLMVSPVTAPFSTCDLSDLFGSPGAHDGAVLQSKPAPPQPVPGVAGSPMLQIVRTSGAQRPAHSATRSAGRPARHIPLRI
jgi:hypothetical protein